MTDQLSTGNVNFEKRKNPAEHLVDVYGGRLPVSIKSVFRVAKTLVVGNEIVAPVINKLAETPITKIIVRTSDEKADTDREKELLDLFNNQLKIHNHLKGISFDNYGFSNGFSSIYFAPKRYLVCPLCAERKKKKENWKKGEKHRWLSTTIKWKFGQAQEERPGTDKKVTAISFSGKCPNCKKDVVFVREDKIYHTKRSLRLIRWDPYYMEIEPYDAIGRNEYYYRIPKDDVERIKRGDKVMLTEYPWAYIESAVNGELLKINPDGFFHFKLEGISGVYKGWGTPRILSVLTALYTVMSIIKANEATSEGRINDLTIISPQPNAKGDDPIGGMGLDAWMQQTSAVIEAFRKDRTLTAYLPFPVHAESIYGKGSVQLVSSELQLYIRNIVAALGLPEDVIFSGGNYTSIAVASRILANQADNMRKTYNEYLNFIKDAISVSLANTDYSGQTLELEPYESADDFQKTSMMIQLAMAGRFPYDPIYKRFGTSYDEVKAQMLKEAEGFAAIMLKDAKSQGRNAAEMGAIQEYYRMQFAQTAARWQVLGQNKDIQDAESATTIEKRKAAAQSLASNIISQYPPEQWPILIQDISINDPELAGMVQTFLDDLGQRMQAESMGAPQIGDGTQPTPNAVPGAVEPQSGGNPLGGVAAIAEGAQMPDRNPPRSQSKL